MLKGIQKQRIQQTQWKNIGLALYVIFFCVLTWIDAAPQGFDRYLNPHAAVVRNAQLEARLPSHLRNPFYQDPRTARALAYSSRLAPGEIPVYSREAEKIPRREIYNVLVHAGFIPRQRSQNRLQYL
ncbi:uncharacterized protein LOC143916457 [Arctopsyche grandis]|uniref:uncharacterized protein LOC143916457 n=1 Tax=Arctopsyche grandis TaxID=121162 RepID=UPI00406D6352